MPLTLPTPPRALDPRGGAQEVARWQREIKEYLARAVAVIDEAASGITDKQDADPTLDALAALTSEPGLLEQTGPDTFTKRALGVAAASSVPTRADGDARYEASGAVAAHVALSDPHTQYAKGPASGTDNALARWDGATGKLLKNSSVTLSDAGVLNVDGEYQVDGVKVLGNQGAAVADASGGATIDTEARAAVNALLARVRAHGMIAT